MKTLRMKKIILMLASVCLSVQAMAADLPPSFRGIWASDDAVFDDQWLVSGTAMYLDTQGNGILMRGPVIASCKEVACARPTGMLFHASVGTDPAKLLMTTKDLSGKVVSGPAWRYDSKTGTLYGIPISLEGIVLAHRSATLSPAVLQVYTEGLTALVKDLPTGFNTYIVPGAAMEPTLKFGTAVLVDLRAYKNRMPERGDIIAYEAVKDERNLYVSRIAALPGDTVEIRDWTLFVNGHAVEVPYASLPKGQKSYSRKMPAMTVPTGTVFALGDNWDVSRDSRFDGVVALQDVIGRVFMQAPSMFEGDYTPVK
jgi:signal peptidase I